MTTAPRAASRVASASFPTVSVRGEIKLGQFLKLAGLVDDGAEARLAIQSGDVTVDGKVETRRGHHLRHGAVVIVDLPMGQAGAVVAAEN